MEYRSGRTFYRVGRGKKRRSGLSATAKRSADWYGWPEPRGERAQRFRVGHLEIASSANPARTGRAERRRGDLGARRPLRSLPGCPRLNQHKDVDRLACRNCEHGSPSARLFHYEEATSSSSRVVEPEPSASSRERWPWRQSLSLPPKPKQEAPGTSTRSPFSTTSRRAMFSEIRILTHAYLASRRSGVRW